MTIYIIDGIPLEFTRPDIDGDGHVDTKSEKIVNYNNQNTTSIIQPTEVGEAMQQLNSDEINPITRMTDMDMRSRLTGYEIPYIMRLDSLVAMGFLPHNCLSITRQKKRLSVSLMGLGRTELVEMMAGKKQHEVETSGGSFVDKIKNFITRKPQA